MTRFKPDHVIVVKGYALHVLKREFNLFTKEEYNRFAENSHWKMRTIGEKVVAVHTTGEIANFYRITE